MLATVASRRIAASACRSLTAASSAAARCSIAPSASAVQHLGQYRHMSSDDLPYHLVVGMPALSPTMESGTIAEWNVKEGDAFAAGDSVAEIETDKATIAFEAQDDGYVAKILVEAGSGEITVGTPVMVTVEEEEDIAAFADFVPPEAEAAPAAAADEPAPAAAAAPEPTPAPPVVEAAPAPPTPPPAAAAPPAPEPLAAPPAPAAAVPAVGSAPTVGPAWGGLARVASPIAKTLSAEQKEYIEKYGTTGQLPL